MPRLSLFLLGPPRLELDGVSLEFKNRKIIALLAYLAVTRQDHSRDALATLLWPDSDQGRARAALRSVLWALNKEAGSAWVEAERETISLSHRAEMWVDVDHFLGHLAACQGHGHPAGEVCPVCLSELAAAMQLYRSKFLAGFTLRDSPDFDDWQSYETERLGREAADALGRLVWGYSAQSGFEVAISYARRWLALDPLHEPAHRHLMQVYAWAGQPATALHHYQKCVRLFEQELGTPPSPETSQLYQAIKRTAFRLRRLLPNPLPPR